MNPVNNNQFEVIPTTKSKRKIVAPCPNVYLNPALDLLVNEDPMCNNAMEIIPVKKRKRTKSVDITTFENSALDLGISKAAINEFLVRELENVKKNVRNTCTEQSLSQNNLNMPRELSIPKKFAGNNIELNSSDNKNVVAPYHEQDNLQGIFDQSTLVENILKSNLTRNNLGCNLSLPNMSILQNQDSVNFNQSIVPRSFDLSLPNTSKEITETVNFPANNTSFPSQNYTQNTHYGLEISQVNSNVTEIDSGISILEQKLDSQIDNDSSAVNFTNIHTEVSNQLFVNNSNLSLSFIDRLVLDSPGASQSIVFDDDLNESNIMEIKTIKIVTTKKSGEMNRTNTNPFLDPNLQEDIDATTANPFLDMNAMKPVLEHNDEVIYRPGEVLIPQSHPIVPRKLFNNDTNSSMSTFNDSVDLHEYENIDDYRVESPIYENVTEDLNFNKQSKILGCDVSHFSAVDIMNLNKMSKTNSSSESNEGKKDLKHQLLKASKLPKKVLKKIRKTFGHEKHEKHAGNATLNPYEVPRKPKEMKNIDRPKDIGIENPGLNLDISDEIEIIDEDEPEYETIKTIRNTRLNMNVTPLKERVNENVDVSQNKTNTPGKKVRFDSTLNQEKVITGNSFDCDIQSPGFDLKIDKYHDELENCINEKKFLQQNM